MTKIKLTPLTKPQLIRKIELQLAEFPICGKLKEKKITKKQIRALLKRKNYCLLKKNKASELFIRKTWPDRAKTLFSQNTHDFSIVILQKEIGSEGLVWTGDGCGGLYDNGNIKSFNELYNFIEKYR